MQQIVTLHNRLHRALSAQPVTYGVPWPQGAIKDIESLSLRDEQGQALSAGFTCLNRWPDGSVQWSLVDFGLDFAPTSNRQVAVSSEPAEAPAPANAAACRIVGDTATIGNGLVELVVSANPGEFLMRWKAERQLLVPNGFDITFFMDGQRYSLKAGPRTLTIEQLNAQRAVLRVDGKHAAADGTAVLDYYLRFEVRAGRADVKVTYAFRNRELATPGLEVSDYVVTLETTAKPGAQRCFTASNRTRHYLTMPLRVPEDPAIVSADTGDIDHYAEMHKKAANGECFVIDKAVLHDPLEAKPWFLRQTNYRQAGIADRIVMPYMCLLDDEGGILTCFENMAGLHPKSLTVRNSTFTLGIYPAWAGTLGITQGAGRSHVFHLAPLAAEATDEDIQNAYLSWEMPSGTGGTPWKPIEIFPDIEHIRACEVFQIHKLPAFDPDGHYLFERKVRDAWIGQSYGTLGAQDEVPSPPNKGFWEFGDHGGNNEEMWARVYFENYLRTGDWGCFELAIAAVQHITEVDYCAFSEDPYQHGGMVAHCANHNDGAAYPSHMWFTELLFAYALTGDEEYKKAALHICENLLFWIHDPDGFLIISSDQREAGQPMINLTFSYEFNRDQRYLDGCRKIIYDYCMDSAQKYGRILDEKPKTMPWKLVNYGDYATWEGMYWYWEITRDETLRRFMLEQCEWRLTEQHCRLHGGHRQADYNPAAYAYYLSGDRQWFDRIQRPFRAVFKASSWPTHWVHAMYAVKLAFDLGIIEDDDITVA
ncbi:MAG: RIFT barrel domain-containing protein [Armatimonadota bacterium]